MTWQLWQRWRWWCYVLWMFYRWLDGAAESQHCGTLSLANQDGSHRCGCLKACLGFMVGSATSNLMLVKASLFASKWLLFGVMITLLFCVHSSFRVRVVLVGFRSCFQEFSWNSVFVSTMSSYLRCWGPGNHELNLYAISSQCPLNFRFSAQFPLNFRSISGCLGRGSNKHKNQSMFVKCSAWGC